MDEAIRLARQVSRMVSERTNQKVYWRSMLAEARCLVDQKPQDALRLLNKYYPPATIVPLFKDKIYPASLTVQQGTMVTWVNADEDGLYVIEGDDFDFISPALGPDQEASYSFDRIGTFKYHDRLHPWTKGTVRVTH
jgi:hypothetical protein